MLRQAASRLRARQQLQAVEVERTLWRSDCVSCGRGEADDPAEADADRSIASSWQMVVERDACMWVTKEGTST